MLPFQENLALNSVMLFLIKFRNRLLGLKHVVLSKKIEN